MAEGQLSGQDFDLQMGGPISEMNLDHTGIKSMQKKSISAIKHYFSQKSVQKRPKEKGWKAISGPLD